MTWVADGETAAQWARERALDLWISVPHGPAWPEIEESLAAVRADGGATLAIASEGSGFPEPFALFEAMRVAGVSDVRRVGVVSDHPAALRAGRRAGLGAVVGIASLPAPALLEAEPDAIVPASAFGGLDAARYGSRRPHRPRVLLNPGPALTSERVKRAAAGLDLCHREPEYAALRLAVLEKLRTAFGLDSSWRAVLLAGSGTAAMEAMVGAAVRPGRRLLVCRNGVYGDRLATIAARLGIDVAFVEASWTEAIAPEDVAASLGRDPMIDAVALVHHETTTGLLNPVAEVAEVARASGRLAVVDAISSLGGEELELEGSGIAMVACTANKCLHGLPGTAFVLLSPSGVERARAALPRSLYLDLATYLDADERGSVPFTPSIPATYALDAALDELLEEGPATRRRRYRERVALLDRELERIGLRPLLPPALRSSSIRAAYLPEGIGFGELHDVLREQGYVIYSGQGKLARSIFRVATLGNVETEALAAFAQRLEEAIAKRRAARA